MITTPDLTVRLAVSVEGFISAMHRLDTAMQASAAALSKLWKVKPSAFRHRHGRRHPPRRHGVRKGAR